MTLLTKLLTDQPLGHRDDPGGRQDGLGFTGYAKILAQATYQTSGPFTIGIFGDWGTGKTSLLRLVQKELLTQIDILPIWFNAWQYEQDEHPIVPLVGTIIDSVVAKAKEDSSWAGTFGANLLRALRAVIYAFSAKASLDLAPIAQIEAGVDMAKVLERFTSEVTAPIVDRSLHYHAFRALSEVRPPEGKHIVVLIDDLDRCVPDKAIYILEGIKTVLGQPGYTFLLGVSRAVLEGRLEHRYRERYKLKQVRGRDYLDKIIQLEFTIPPHTTKMEEFVSGLIREVDPSNRMALQGTLKRILRQLGDNPRTVVRFINCLLLALHLSGEPTDTTRLESLAVTRLLQLRWPEFFSAVAGHQDAANFALANINGNEPAPKPDSARKRHVLDSLEDDALRGFLESFEPCTRWLENEEVRRSAVLYVNTTAGEAPKPAAPKFTRNQDVATIVGSNNQDDAHRMRQAIGAQEMQFCPQHSAHLLGEDVPRFAGDASVRVFAQSPLEAIQQR
jgi:hypothetical protein